MGLPNASYPQVINKMPTDLSPIFMLLGILFAVILAIVAIFKAQNASDDAYEAMRYVETQNKRSRTLKQVAEISADLTELRDAYQALLKSHKTIRSRMGMRDVREKKKAAQNGSGDVEALTDGEKTDLKAQLRAELTAKGRL